jgi:hypothetical protein
MCLIYLLRFLLTVILLIEFVKEECIIKELQGVFGCRHLCISQWMRYPGYIQRQSSAYILEIQVIIWVPVVGYN